ncbi:MAG: DUF481 domain-containing protein [Planctomycetota bacterium]
MKTKNLQCLLNWTAICFAVLTPRSASAQLDFSINAGDVVSNVDEQIWTGSFGSGLNGKTGNSENLDFNLNLDMQRRLDLRTTKFQANYFFAKNQIATTTDRFFSMLRDERDFVQNPQWSWFGQGTYENDEFKAFDYRLAMHTGLAYKVFEYDDRFLKLRFGGGASRQVGGVNDDWVGEIQFGGDWEKKFTDRTRAYAAVDYFPNASDFSDYRLNTSGGLEFVVDDALNLNFRIFFLNIYDSTPEPGNVRNDLDYGMAFVFGF